MGDGLRKLKVKGIFINKLNEYWLLVSSQSIFNWLLQNLLWKGQITNICLISHFFALQSYKIKLIAKVLFQSKFKIIHTIE